VPRNRYILPMVGTEPTDEAAEWLAAGAGKPAVGSERSSLRPGLLNEDEMATKNPRLEGRLLVLMTPEERAEIDAGAQRAGLPTGGWLRMLGLVAARKDGAKKGGKRK
jgi:hypothetical protein